MTLKFLKFFRSSHFIATLHSKHIFWDSWDNIFSVRSLKNLHHREGASLFQSQTITICRNLSEFVGNLSELSDFFPLPPESCVSAFFCIGYQTRKDVRNVFGAKPSHHKHEQLVGICWNFTENTMFSCANQRRLDTHDVPMLISYIKIYFQIFNCYVLICFAH